MAAEWTTGGCPTVSDTGAFRLEWTGPQKVAFRVEQVKDSGSTLVYEGTDTATTITGAQKGTLSYRVGVVGDESGAWSKSCAVTVDPPSMALALTLFAIGALVSIATVATIVRGHRAHRAGELS